MSKFAKITSDVVAADELFVRYFSNSKILAARKGGTFVGNYEMAPDAFRKYGIVLPKGGMIIPDMEPDELKNELVKGWNILVEKKNDAIKTAQAEREKEKQSYLAEVSRLLEQYNIPGLGIVECLRETGNSSWAAVTMEVLHGVSYSNMEIKTLFVFGNDAAFLLRTERDPDELESYVRYTPIVEVEEFLRAEARIFSTRQKFLKRVQTVVAKNSELSHWGSSKYDDRITTAAYGNRWEGELDFSPLRPGLNSAHELKFRNKKYSFQEEDVAELERLVSEAEKDRQNRLDHLWQLFRDAQGEFTSVQEKDWGEYCGDYKKTVYYVGGERPTPQEINWLKSRLNEIQIPSGYYRVPNDTNTIKPLPTLPESRKDTLLLYGKTGQSRRGVDPEGVIWQGHIGHFCKEFGSGWTWWITLNGENISIGKRTEDKWYVIRKLAEAGAVWDTKEARVVRFLKPRAEYDEVTKLTLAVMGSAEIPCGGKEVVAEAKAIIEAMRQQKPEK